MTTHNSFEKENDLKEAINEITNKKGFKVKNHGRKDNLILIYYCEYIGKQRETKSQGLRKKQSKKTSK